MIFMPGLLANNELAQWSNPSVLETRDRKKPFKAAQRGKAADHTFRFAESCREVEEMMALRGVQVTYETVPE
jgi:transposase-like protein